MPVNLRTLGVHGKNLPAKRNLSVVPADFSIGGMLVEAERAFNRTYKVSTMEEYRDIFGSQIDSTQYGADAIKGFFDNVVGVDASIYVQSLIGYDIAGDAIDAVTAVREKADVGAVADAFTIQDAYEDELGYGTSGNRTGTKFTLADRFTTAAAAGVAATGVSTAQLDSVIGIRVGDLIQFKTTVPAGNIYKIVTEIDESAKTVSWSGNFESAPAAGEVLTINDEVVIPGFRIQTYRKSITGIETEVETELGKKICSTQSAVTEFFVDNIFKTSKWIKVTYVSVSTLADRLPANDASVIYPTAALGTLGADGTAVVTVEAQDYFLANFADDPIRFIANPETTDVSMQTALVTYSLSRDDNPIVILNIAEDRTKAQLIAIGNGYQKSDYRPAVIAANWLKVDDPFSSSVIAPDRTIPNVGHVMGLWIRTIGQLGIHFIPATNQSIMNGVNGIVGDQFLNDDDRTDIAEAGVNLIQEITGTGIKIANLFTISTDSVYFFSNGILMRNYIKVSAEDSISVSENTPNSLNRIATDKMAILGFLYNLWFRGSTGNVPEGETFGQGEGTVAEDHFQVIADATNNPQASINLGERTISVYFTYPTAAGSIEIGVGILVR